MEKEVASTMLVIQEGTQFIAMGVDGSTRLFQVEMNSDGKPYCAPKGIA